MKIRFDRFLTLHAFRYLMKILPKQTGIHVPILMYHSISDEPESGHPYYWINTSPKLFYEHMKFLKFNNYKVISLTEAANIISKPNYPNNSINRINSCNPIDSSNRTNPSNLVVLTFDDGYHDFYTSAWPILLEFGFTATVFLPTAFVDDPSHPFPVGSYRLLAFQPHGNQSRPCLSWQEVRELHSQGVCFGSHTVTHPQLHGMPWHEIKMELVDSKKALEDQLGIHVEDFSYPYAYPEADRPFCRRLAQALRECGYAHCVTTRIGSYARGEDVLSLKRLPISDADDLSLFRAKLEGCYDWLAVAQRLLKTLRRIARRSTTWSDAIQRVKPKLGHIL